jgi:isoleucyl-tRNA synthetase
MSKSVGNTISAVKATEQYGADVLRLYVASMDYADDIRMSERGIKEMSEAYRKIRNTFRYLLGNLGDYASFDPATVAHDSLQEIDRWALGQLNHVISDVVKAYKDFEFYRVYQRIYQFCSVELSSFYLDVLKDRLYAEAPEGPERRGAQFVMARLHSVLTRLLAPIIPHTAEELWEFVPPAERVVASVHLAEWPEPDAEWDETAGRFTVPWTSLTSIRTDVLRDLEKLRAAKTIGSSQEATVWLGSDDSEDLAMLEKARELLETVCIVSEVLVGGERPNGAASLTDFPKAWVHTRKSPHPKCERCWNLRPSVGRDSQHPTLCERCARVVSSLGVGS